MLQVCLLYTSASELLTLKNEEVGSNIHNGSIKVDINKTMEKADINQDGKIDKADSKLIEERILNKSSSEIDADLNLDKKIDVKDLVMLNEIIKIMSES